VDDGREVPPERSVSSAWPLDPDRYYEQVVRGLRGRPHDLPPDLVLRYAVPDRPTEPALRAHLELVLKDWEARVEATRQGEDYRALLTAHQELDADPDVDLRSPEWWTLMAPAGRCPERDKGRVGGRLVIRSLGAPPSNGT
jgi:hypothetical protein